jgi:hypothetical protein
VFLFVWIDATNRLAKKFKTTYDDQLRLGSAQRNIHAPSVSQKADALKPRAWVVFSPAR